MTNNTQGGNEIGKERVKKLEVALVSTKVQGAGSEDTFEQWVGELQDHGFIHG